MDVLAAHISLAILLFFIVNWIGGHAIGAGYHQLSIFGAVDEAPAFNTLFRVLAPIVFLLITASGWYALGLDAFVKHYWLIAVYYVSFRWLFNLALGRTSLLSFSRQIVIGVLTVGAAFVAYDKLIQYRTNLLPDPQNLANEVWLIILLFLYDTWNRVEASTKATGSVARGKRYVQRRYATLYAHYGNVVAQNAQKPVVEALAFAVMVYEQFNRPPVYQWIERHLLFPLGRSRTIGPMQVYVQELVSDEESVALAVQKLQRDYDQAIQKSYAQVQTQKRLQRGISAAASLPESPNVTEWFNTLPSYFRLDLRRSALSSYNIRSDYAREVDWVFTTLVEKFYPGLIEKEIGLG